MTGTRKEHKYTENKSKEETGRISKVGMRRNLRMSADGGSYPLAKENKIS